MGKHIYSSDFSAYGYVGSAIEKFKADEVITLLAQYKERDSEQDTRDLYSVTRGKSLFDLALDNIAYAKNDKQFAEAFTIIETLIEDEDFDINILDNKGNGHTPISRVLDLYQEYAANEKILEQLAKFAQQICAKEGFEAQLLYYADDTIQNLHSLKEILGDELMQPILKAVAEEALASENREAGLAIFQELSSDDDLSFVPKLTDDDPLAKQLLAAYSEDELSADLVYSFLTTAINSREDEQQNTLLHLASNKGDGKLVAKILRNPALDLELKNSNGNTALKEAMLNDKYDVAVQLVKAGAKLEFDLGIDQTIPGWIKNSIKTERVDPLESACMDGEVALDLAKAIITRKRYIIDAQRDTFNIIYSSKISEQILPEFLKRAAKTPNVIQYKDFKKILEDACAKERIPEALALLEYYTQIKGKLPGLENPQEIINIQVVKDVYDKVETGKKDELKPLLKALTKTFKIDSNKKFIPGGIVFGKEKNVLQAFLQNSDTSLVDTILQADDNGITYPIFKSALEEMIDNNKPLHANKLLEFFARKNYKLEAQDMDIKNLITPAHIGQVFRRAYKENKQNAETYQQLFTQILATNLIDLSQQIVTEPGKITHTYKTVQQAIIETNDYKLYQQLFNHPNFSFASLKEEEKFELAKYVTNLPYKDFRGLVDKFFVGSKNKNVRDFIVVVTQELIQQDTLAYLDYLQKQKVIPDEIELFQKQDAISLYKHGNADVLKYLLYKKIDLNQVDEKGNTLLHLAAANGHKELALELIKQGASLQEKNADGLTPLMILSISKNPQNQDIAKAIIDDPKFDLAKERVKVATGQKHNPGDLPQVLLAYMKGNIGVAKMILDKLDQTSPGIEEHKIIIQKAFLTAYLNADVELVKIILNNNPDLNINRITNKEDAARVIQPIFAIYDLYKASDGELKARYLEIIKAVINQEGFEINQSNIKGQPLLTVASADGEIELVQLLLANQKEKELDLNKESPLASAYQALASLEAQNKPENQVRINRLYETAKLLLSQADVSTNIQDKVTEEYIAALVYKKLQTVKQENKPENAEQLHNLENLFAAFLDNSNTKSNLNKDKAGKDLLMLAIEANDPNTFDKLMNRESNLAIEQTDAAENTAILHAYASGNAHFVETLIRKAASIEVINDQGTNVLMAACRGGNPQLIQNLLTDDSIFKDDSDISGNRAIHYLVGSDLNEADTVLNIIKELEKNAFNINAVNNDKQSALILAVVKGDLTKVGALLDAGADVNLKDKDGNTALMYACMLNRSDIAQKILSNNQVDVNITNNDGINAYMLAAVRGNCNGMAENWKGDPKLMQALINHGADPIFGSYYSGLGDKLKVTFAKAALIAVANQGVAKLMPIPLLQESVNTMNAINTGFNVYKDVSSSTENMIREFFNKGTERAVKIDLANTYVGYHIGRFGVVTYGEQMKTLLGKHDFFEHPDKGLYNTNDVASWSKSHLGDNAKQQDLHKNLTAQYLNIQKQLQGYLWPWTRSALNAVAQDIEAASQHLLLGYKNPLGEGGFDKKFEGFTEMLNPKNRDKFIVYMLEHPEQADKYNLLLDAIIKDEILVSPKTYCEAIQFKKRMGELAHQKENPGIVRKIIGFTAGRKLGQVGIEKVAKLNPQIEDNLVNFKALRTKLRDESKVGELQSNSPSQSKFKEETLKLVAGLMGKDVGKLVEDVAVVGGKVGGVVSGVAVAAAMEPAKAKLAYDVVKDGLGLGAKVVSVGYAAVNMAAIGSVATTVGPVIGVAALASTAIYVLYQGQQAVANRLRKDAEFAALIPKTIEDVYANSVSLNHIKLFTEDKIDGLKAPEARDFTVIAARLPLDLLIGVVPSPVDLSTSTSIPVADTKPKVKGADQLVLGIAAEERQKGSSSQDIRG